jgi:hypothetical protein
MISTIFFQFPRFLLSDQQGKEARRGPINLTHFRQVAQGCRHFDMGDDKHVKKQSAAIIKYRPTNDSAFSK